MFVSGDRVDLSAGLDSSVRKVVSAKVILSTVGEAQGLRLSQFRERISTAVFSGSIINPTRGSSPVTPAITTSMTSAPGPNNPSVSALDAISSSSPAGRHAPVVAGGTDERPKSVSAVNHNAILKM